MPYCTKLHHSNTLRCLANLNITLPSLYVTLPTQCFTTPTLCNATPPLYAALLHLYCTLQFPCCTKQNPALTVLNATLPTPLLNYTLPSHHYAKLNFAVAFLDLTMPSLYKTSLHQNYTRRNNAFALLCFFFSPFELSVCSVPPLSDSLKLPIIQQFPYNV